MDKFCVFCGEKPKEKTKEHIIPKWLIKMTEHQGRKPFFAKKGDETLFMPWNRYVFPACKKCNEDFSALEAEVKLIIDKIENNQGLSQNDINLLLDWFDKIRIGIWLGQSLLKGEELQPNFYIKQRLRMSDRLLTISKIASTDKGIGFTGTNSLAFIYMPSCFSLTINNINFFNCSGAFMLSKNMGFPYPEDITIYPNGQIGISEINIGKQRVTKPFLDGNVIYPSIKIYQTIIKINGGDLYDFPSSYIVDNCMENNRKYLVSKPYIIDDLSGYDKYMDSNENVRLDLGLGYSKDNVLLNSALMVFQHQQIEILKTLNLIKYAPEEEREKMKYRYQIILDDNAKYMNRILSDFK